MANVRSYHVKGNRERKTKSLTRRECKLVRMGEAAMERYADRKAAKGKQ